jgi:hypothetical protein
MGDDDATHDVCDRQFLRVGLCPGQARGKGGLAASVVAVEGMTTTRQVPMPVGASVVRVDLPRAW